MMKISAKIDYACKALLELSLHYPNNTPLPLVNVAKNQQIPMKFLTQILLTLKQIGCVVSIRGKNGGYLLNRAPEEITLKDVVAAFDDVNIGSSVDGVFVSIWGEVNDVMMEKMESVHFGEIKNRYQQQTENVLYVI